MRSSNRTRLAAAIGFVLIAVLLIGGMSWATVATFELAKRNVEEEHLRHTRLAVSEIDRYMSGVLESEFGRPYTDYLPVHAEVPRVFIPEDGTEMVEGGLAVLDSPLMESGPPHDWIDLYFQVEETGTWTSPQIPPGFSPWECTASAYQAYRTLRWLETALPFGELCDRLDRALEHEPMAGLALVESPRLSPLDERKSGVQPRAPSRKPLAPDYERRVQETIAAQHRSRPSPQCVPVRLVEYSQCCNYPGCACGVPDPSPEDRTAPAQHPFTCSPPVYVAISPDPMVPLWIGNDATEPTKLAFVRTGSEDNKRVHQGLLVDWDRLKLRLLERVTPWFERADLEAVPDDVSVDPETSATALSSIPARLAIPPVPGGVATVAWRKVRGVLFTTWGVALAVLALAGWGLRNLVKLTERRMQFAYAVTHELRTPLTTFCLYSDMLAAGLVPSESKQEYLDTLNRESLRLSGLVEGVLEYARLDNHKAKLDLVKTDASALLATLSEELQKRCTDNGVTAETRNGIANGRAIRVDVRLVNQIAGVLINNACRHARAAPEPRVLVDLSADGGHIFLDVIDSGPGIDRSDARTIFKPFRRGRKAGATAQGGIGLGLALARSWAALLGGRLDLVERHHPTYGGAYFRLTIPARMET